GATEHVPCARPGEAPTEVRNLTQLHTRARDRKEKRVTEDADQMMVHLVLEAGGSSRVRARHSILQAQTRSVWEDHPLPRDEDALLPVDHLGVVEPDQASTLRNQEMLTRLGVENGLAHLRDQLPREVRANPRQEHRRNDGSGLHLVRTHGLAESRGENVRAL